MTIDHAPKDPSYLDHITACRDRQFQTALEDMDRPTPGFWITDEQRSPNKLSVSTESTLWVHLLHPLEPRRAKANTLLLRLIHLVLERINGQ